MGQLELVDRIGHSGFLLPGQVAVGDDKHIDVRIGFANLLGRAPEDGDRGPGQEPSDDSSLLVQDLLILGSNRGGRIQALLTPPLRPPRRKGEWCRGPGAMGIIAWKYEPLVVPFAGEW